MNVLNCIGRVGRDAEMRYTQNGDPICQWSVAIDIGYGDNRKTTWLNCSLFGKRGESLVNYIRKGDQIGVTGAIFLNEYETKAGGNGARLECRVNDVTLISQKDEAPHNSPNVRTSELEQLSAKLPDTKDIADIDDDLPF